MHAGTGRVSSDSRLATSPVAVSRTATTTTATVVGVKMKAEQTLAEAARIWAALKVPTPRLRLKVSGCLHTRRILAEQSDRTGLKIRHK